MPGDALLTYDPITGAEWLDLSATAGMSYNQVRASEFFTNYGFAHATWDQVGAFVEHAIPSREWGGGPFGSKEEKLADPGARAVLDLYEWWTGAPLELPFIPATTVQTYTFINGLVAERILDAPPSSTTRGYGCSDTIMMVKPTFPSVKNLWGRSSFSQGRTPLGLSTSSEASPCPTKRLVSGCYSP